MSNIWKAYEERRRKQITGVDGAQLYRRPWPVSPGHRCPCIVHTVCLLFSQLVLTARFPWPCSVCGRRCGFLSPLRPGWCFLRPPLCGPVGTAELCSFRNFQNCCTGPHFAACEARAAPGLEGYREGARLLVPFVPCLSPCSTIRCALSGSVLVEGHAGPSGSVV